MNALNTMAGRCALVCALLVAGAAAAEPAAVHRVHTDPSQVHACVPMADRTLAATGGGLVLVGADHAPRALWTALDGLPGTRMQALLREGDSLWVGGERGVARVRIRGRRIEILERHATAPVHALVRHGRDLYIGTWSNEQSGVLRLREGTLTAIAGPAARSRVTDLAVMNDTIIAATAGGGLYRLEQGRLQPMAAGLEHTLVWSLAPRGSMLWAGTVDGLYVIEQGEGGEQGVRRVARGDVRHVHVRGSELWLATFGQGLQRFDPDRPMRTEAHGPDAQLAYTYAESSGAACMGTHEGLWLRPALSSAWRRVMLSGPPSGDISALAADGERLWVGTFDRGLAVYERGRWRRVHTDRVDPHINALAVESGRVWVGTSAGLSVIEHGQVMRMDHRDGLPSRHVLSLAVLQDQRGVLVGTTRGAALIRDGELTAMGRKQGLYTGNVWAVAQDHAGWIWLGTTRGLYRGRPGQRWQRLSVATGHLRDDWVMAIALAGESLWIGTYKGGVTRLEPGRDGYQAGYQATHIGGGWINPGGLTWDRGTLYAATMDGLLRGDGATFQAPERVAPGRDTTAVARQGARLWIASRRGLLAVDAMRWSSLRGPANAADGHPKAEVF